MDNTRSSYTYESIYQNLGEIKAYFTRLEGQNQQEII